MKTQSPFPRYPSMMLAAMDKISAATAAAMNTPVTPVKFKKPSYCLVQALANPDKVWSQGKIMRDCHRTEGNLIFYLCLSTKENREQKTEA